MGEIFLTALRGLVLILLAPALGIGTAHAESSLLGLRLIQQQHVMVHLDLSVQPIDEQLFTLKAPDRLVIDLAETSLGGDWTEREFAEGVVKRVRHGVQEQKHLRLVFDLTGPVKPAYRYVHRANGTRLVIDLGVEGNPASPDALSQIVESLPAGPDNNHSRFPSTVQPSKPLVKSTPPPPRQLIVVIDAGHGGKDPGAIGRKKTKEKDITLAIAKRLFSRLSRERSIKPLMIRDDDRYVSLRGRLDLAREYQADLFISIHADAVPRMTAKGSSVYILSLQEASSETAQWLADNEKVSDLFGEVVISGKSRDLQKTLLELAHNNTIGSSAHLGKLVIDELKKIGPTHKDTVEMADFAVLKSMDIPSVLVETTFISNPKEEKKLRSRRFQDRIARALQTGIMNYFISRSPEGTLLADYRR